MYNNRAAVPDHPAVMARWRGTAVAARALHPPVKLAYGPGPRETIDLFEAPRPAQGGPVVVFIHGGYWQALDPSWFSGIAPAFLAHGVGVAIPAYDLCPDVPLARIVDQMRAAVDMVTALTGRVPVVFGHSAGGHLAACLLGEGRAAAAVAISGVFDLEPLIETSLNTALGLDVGTARALSPLHWVVPQGGVLDCVVGGDETAAFLEQSRTMAEVWGAQGAVTRYQALPGLNHFTVLDPLLDPDSALVARIVALSCSSAG
nr:alpha/beta hydrolase [Brevundimonas variabilis]